VYDLQVTISGKPATCQQYAKDKTTPLYKVRLRDIAYSVAQGNRYVEHLA
jgi:hypothetical protein